MFQQMAHGKWGGVCEGQEPHVGGLYGVWASIFLDGSVQEFFSFLTQL